MDKRDTIETLIKHIHRHEDAGDESKATVVTEVLRVELDELNAKMKGMQDEHTIKGTAAEILGPSPIHGGSVQGNRSKARRQNGEPWLGSHA